ncbi:phospholipase A2 [Amycolatopsis regifaucium]|uniref:Phospholipase n=1 Tax=Amycolatopsis regifaucium TaxID=546365 RepID=A0A154MK65_9PSEU|nr:phospholipase A2 [Amycolatopsis regifaucium]KZB83809.1 phospholipase [Amycolatopsis regifaucium]OKA06749.1 phospholipase [Amycolatopsis regifaucium]SFH25937.1 phospholipase A2 [Amycolatopsis regifaucium]
MPATADADLPPARIRRPWSTSGWLLLVTVLVFGFGLIASRPASPPDQGPPTGDILAAQNAVDALVRPGPVEGAIAKLPADFTAVSGITPGVMTARDGTVRAVHTDGGCSAPWGDDNTKWDYAVPCKAHDLGYDILRYAERKGHPLGQEARTALDDRLSADMHTACVINPMDSRGTCEVVASLYTAGLVLNSWHQRWGPPVGGDPLGPMIVGVLVIGALLVFRLRGWARTRRTAVTLPREPRPVVPIGRWALLGVAGVVLMLLGESAVALVHWAGVPERSLWPFTWLAQLCPLIFFAVGRINEAGWHSIRATGGRYSQYLADRASPLLRPALIFAVVALVVPLALEVLGIPTGTNATVMRIALHPLWLLGVFLLTVVLAPALLCLYRRTRTASVAALLALTLASEVAAQWSGSAIPRYAETLFLALFVQQLAFAHADGVRPPRGVLLATAFTGAAGLGLAIAVRGEGVMLLGGPGAPAALSGAPWGVLLLGLVQLALLGLLARPLARLGNRPAVAATARLILRAPMSLYLGFLSAMLLLVAVVYLPAPFVDGLSWLARPRVLLALALLAVPAVLVFWWFERHSGPRQRAVDEPGLRAAVFCRAAATVGMAYAMLGVFGFALARFGGASADADLLGLRLGPVQSLVNLLLGVYLLHTVRNGTSRMTGTWLVCAVACAPPLMGALDGTQVSAAAVALPVATIVVAMLAAAASLVPARAARRVLS